MAGDGGAPASGGIAGKGGAGGSAGHSGAGGTGGASSAGGSSGHGGTSSNGGSAGHSGAGAGGTVNTPGYIPASKNCAAGNVLAAYSVCRNCHGTTPDPDFNVPFTLVTLADLQEHAPSEYDEVSTGGMPKAGAFASAANCSPAGATTSCKDVLLNWLAAGANGVPALNGLCAAP